MKKLLIILLSFIIIISTTGCGKEEDYIFKNGVYTTINGVKIPEEKFKELATGYIDSVITNMKQNKFDKLLGNMTRKEFDEIIENTERIDFNDDIYTNKKNVKISREDFNQLMKYYKFDEIENMSQEELDTAFDGIYCIKGYDENHNLIKVPFEECQ